VDRGYHARLEPTDDAGAIGEIVRKMLTGAATKGRQVSGHNLTTRNLDSSRLVATVWHNSMTRADLSGMVLVEDLLDDLGAEGKDREIESL
jgi:hypothetical protein